MLYLVGYDTPCDRRRARFLRTLKCAATGGQKSVYECWFTSAELQAAQHTLRTLMDATEDRAFFLRLDPRARVHVLGVATAPQYQPFIVFA